MRTSTKEMTNLTLSLFALLAFIGFGQAYAADIYCETAFKEKAFTIEDSTIAFHSSDESGRSISSVEESRTQVTHMGYKKVLYRDGSKHLISIENTKSLTDGDNFLAITNQKGHKMTFPLNCKNLN